MKWTRSGIKPSAKSGPSGIGTSLTIPGGSVARAPLAAGQSGDAFVTCCESEQSVRGTAIEILLALTARDSLLISRVQRKGRVPLVDEGAGRAYRVRHARA